MTTLTARWIFPVDQPPLENGTLTMEGEKIVAIEPAGRRPADQDLGEVAILPGLVNAHTHLDLSHLRGKCPPTRDFTAWLREVIRHRRATTPEATDQAVAEGLRESIQFGVTLLGDSSASGLSWPQLANASIRAVVFNELLGLSVPRATQASLYALRWVRSHPATATCRPGLSPHAPYSVHQFLCRLLALLARKRGLPLTTHLAETREELLLLSDHQGPFVPFLRELGVWDEKGLVHSIAEYVQRCNPGTPLLLAHANYLSLADLPLPDNSTVVYCPRTHAAFGHDPHPLPDLLKAGVRVALGTDSLASNPDLDLLAEARFVRMRFPQLPGEQILRLATLNGAEALGWADETGSLTPGKSADLVVVPLGKKINGDPHEAVLDQATKVERVMCRGQWL